jgi:hypothetical protein
MDFNENYSHLKKGQLFKDNFLRNDPTTQNNNIIMSLQRLYMG